MSHYTTEVRFLCETYAGLDHSEDYPNVDSIVEAARSKVFGDYPIFDESYRAVLEKKILKHYYTREISAETVALWKLWLNNRMNEIMPYYNQLYRSQLIEFNPLYDIDYTRDYHRNNEDHGNGHSDGTDKRNESNTSQNSSSDTAWSMFSDTPQGGLVGIENGNYLTNATKNTDSASGSGSSTHTANNTTSSGYVNNMNGIEDYVEHVKGTHGGVSYAKKLQEFRKTFLNIDLQIINELKDLFFYLW